MKNLNYYVFDIDDNLLKMPTIIHLDKFIDGRWQPADVPTYRFVKIKEEVFKSSMGEKSEWRFRNGNYDETYSEFGDNGVRCHRSFLDDIRYAMRNGHYSPAFEMFKQCIRNANLFMILTMRGHEPDTIKNGIQDIILNHLCMDGDFANDLINNILRFNDMFGFPSTSNRNRLIKTYLDHNEYIGITSNWFKTNYNIDNLQSIKPDIHKPIALDHFVKRIHEYGRQAKMGVNLSISDDCKKTVDAIKMHTADKLSEIYPIGYDIYHTEKKLEKI